MARIMTHDTRTGAHADQAPAKRRDLIAFALFYRIDATDRFAARFPVVMFIGLLLILGLAGQLEEVLG